MTTEDRARTPATDRARDRARAASPDTHPEVLAVLATHPLWRVRAAIASNPAAPERVLVHLAADPAVRVRRRLVANPSSTAPVLELLARDPVRALRRLLLQKRPDVEVLRALAGDPLLGPPALAQLARVAGSGDPQSAARLAVDPDPRVRAAVCAGPRAGGAVFEVAAGQADLRPVLAANPHLDAAQLRRLHAGAAREVAVVRALAGNPATPPDLLVHLLGSDRSDVRARAAANPSLPAAAIATAARDGSARVQCAAAANPAAPEDVASLLAHAPLPMVRFALARNPGLPAPARARLAHDDDVWVRGMARTHPASTPEDLAALAAADDEPAWVLRRAAAHTSCPTDARDAMRARLARGDATGDPGFDPVTCTGNPGDGSSPPAPTWKALAGDPARASGHALWMVRLARVVHLAGADEAGGFVDDPHPRVRERCARRAIPVADLRRLCDDEDPRVTATAVRRLGLRPVPAGPGHRRGVVAACVGFAAAAAAVVLVLAMPGARGDALQAIAPAPTTTVPPTTSVPRTTTAPPTTAPSTSSVRASTTTRRFATGSLNKRVVPAGDADAIERAAAADPATTTDALGRGIAHWRVASVNATTSRGTLLLTAADQPLLVGIAWRLTAASDSVRVEPGTTVEVTIEYDADAAVTIGEILSHTSVAYRLHPCATDGSRPTCRP